MLQIHFKCCSNQGIPGMNLSVLSEEQFVLLCLFVEITWNRHVCDATQQLYCPRLG